ncbi:MAG: outer membrane beta-barrel protein [Bacteroidota bacterium]|nr:outer membrane beta-barrel protein [Bacteroidota bacterium]
MKRFALTVITSIILISLFTVVHALPPYPTSKGKLILTPLSRNIFLKKRWGPEIIVGSQIGLSASNIKGLDAEDTKMIMATAGGLFVRLQNNPGSYFQLGVNYSSKGYNKKSTYEKGASTITDDYAISLNYIEIPANIGISFGEILLYNIDAGAYISFLNSANQKGKRTEETEGFGTVSHDINVNLKEDFNNTDFGFLFGGGVQYPITDKRRGTNISVFANTAMYFSMLKLMPNADIKNRNYRLTLGVLFHLDK